MPNQVTLTSEDRAQAVLNARCLFTLLRDKVQVAEMIAKANIAGFGYGARFNATLDDLVSHFTGERTLAIVCADERQRTHMGAFDIDERAEERTPLLAAILERQQIWTIATTGSASGKGKLLAFFRFGQSARSLQLHLQKVLDEARQQSTWGIERAKTVEIRPQSGEGGLLRIGGRHVFRNGPLETFFHPLTAEVMSLADVRLSTLKLRPTPIPVPLGPLRPNVKKWLEAGIKRDAGGSRRIFSHLIELAHEARRGRDDVSGEQQFFTWWRLICTKSPELDDGTLYDPKSRNPLGLRSARNAWCRVLNDKKYTLLTSCRVCSVHTVIQKVREFMVQRGFLIVIGLSYREIAKYLGTSTMQVHNLIRRLEHEGHIIIPFRGTKGSKGIPTMFSLPHFLDDAQACYREPVVVAAIKRQQAYLRGSATQSKIPRPSASAPSSIDQQQSVPRPPRPKPVLDARAAALSYHMEQRSSVAFSTLHISGFLAGASGNGKNPFPQGGIQHDEWAKARSAGRQYRRGTVY